MGRRFKFVVGAVFFLIVSCAVITVNIYFPEKDVKEAYKALEKELMAPGQKPSNGQPVEKKPEGGQQGLNRFEFVASAFAIEPGISDKIAATMKRMPEVVNAYSEMGGRIADTERLRDSGAAGEGNDGLLAVRDKGQLKSGDQAIISAENENRRTVILGMARSIVRINRLQETKENMDQVLPQATEQFAAVRRESAKKGWWVQDASGNWARK